LKFRASLLAAVSAGLLLSACETPSYGAGGVIGASAPPACGVFAHAGDLDALPVTPVPVARLEAAAETGAASPTLEAHETKTAALFTGRSFLAAGKVLAHPAAETPRALVNQQVPSGWRQSDNRLVHNESGLECPLEFDFKAGNEKAGALSLIDVTSYDAANRDVSCNYSNGGASVVTMYASFYPDISVEDHAAAAIAAMRRTFTLKGVLPVVSVEIEDKDAGTTTADLEVPIAGGFDIGDINGAPYKTSLWIAKTHGWHVKTRATYAQSDMTSELVAAVIFAANYLNVDMKNKNNTTTKGPEV
jgi:hypothetical protein